MNNKVPTNIKLVYYRKYNRPSGDETKYDASIKVGTNLPKKIRNSYIKDAESFIQMDCANIAYELMDVWETGWIERVTVNGLLKVNTSISGEELTMYDQHWQYQ